MDWFLYDRDIRYERVNGFLLETAHHTYLTIHTYYIIHTALTRFSAMFNFYTHKKHQKTYVFLMLPGGIEV